MGEFLEPSDFPGIDDAETLIDDAESLAILSAPCLAGGMTALQPFQYKAARAIMRGAVLRWNDAGTGAVESQSAGPFSMSTTTQARRNSYWPSEKSDLKEICRNPNSGKAFSIDTLASGLSSHSPTCSLVFGATHCTCGADIGGSDGPIYDLDGVS